MRFNQFVSEMDSQGYSGSRDKKSHSKYGSRDDYELGEPETTLGPDSIAKPKDVAKQGMSALSKAMKQAHSKDVAEGLESNVATEAYTVTRGIDKERYQARPGLEGPFSTKSGKVVYYDKVEGKYYDPDTDMYIEYDDWRAMNEGGSALSQAVREAGWGRRSSYYNPMDQERREQDQMDYERRAFKRAELQHELGHEDDPNFERNLRQQQIDRDRGPWYIRIDGKVYRQKGQPKSFDWKRGANNYALAMIKNNPGLQGKIMLTKSAEDQ